MKELTTIQARLLALQDEAYRAFHKSLVPTLQQELIGVRVPQVRKLAKELAGTQESEAFLNELPHRFYEENLLHAIWLSAEKDFDRALSGIERFLPYVDNWAVCDAFTRRSSQSIRRRFSPASAAGSHRQDLHHPLRRRHADAVLSGRSFLPEQLRWVGTIESGEYYVNMARAWYFATALAKQQPDTLSYLLENRLDVWTHNKTIQKAIESYRISPELKTFLRTQKR